ncbi:hypothetical protein F4779DRAFT_630034 [Xylariaceae sp. FL0662B]|nr:hypothetical protein F4779DRAFT_630034 [Xylariaceae sp. FL0662B]
MIGTHRDNAQFSRARWRKLLLLPCWIIQILLLLGIIGLFSYRLSYTARTWKENEEDGELPLVEFIWEGVNIAFSLISLVVTFTSVAKFIAEVLTPLPLLFSNILSLSLSGAVLALDVVVYVQQADRHYSVIGLAMDCTLIIFILIPTIYSVIIYRRLLAYDDYHLPGNYKPYGWANANKPEETAYPSLSFLSPPLPYDPTGGPDAARRNSSASARPRSLSAGRRISLTFSRGPSPTPPQPTSPPAAQPDRAERPASYDHKRDTQFDEYVQSRLQNGVGSVQSSTHLFRDDVERALGTEFGWGLGPGSSDDDTVDRRERDSGVSAGVVTAAQTRPRPSSFPRQTSWEASVSGVSSGSGGGGSLSTTSTDLSVDTVVPTRAHSLVSVPEAHEEEDNARRLGSAGARRSWKSQPSGEREALLLSGDASAVSRNSSGSSGASSRRIEPVEEELEEIELDNNHRKRRRDA